MKKFPVILAAVFVVALAAAGLAAAGVDVSQAPQLLGALFTTESGAGLMLAAAGGGLPPAALAELKSLTQQLGNSFQDFKHEHNRILETQNRRIEEVNNGLTEINCRFAGLELSGSIPYRDSYAANQGKGPRREPSGPLNNALRSFIKQGDPSALHEMQVNAGMSVGSDPDGGWTVIPSLSREIYSTARDQSALRRLARTETIAKGDAWEQLVSTGRAGTSWVGETEARPATASPPMKAIHIQLHEAYSSVPVTQKLLDDSSYDIAGFVTGEIGEAFGQDDGEAFTSGNGVLKPRGILTYDISALADSTRPFFEIQYIPTGASGDFLRNSPADGSESDPLIDALYALRPAYRRNATWVMNSNTAALIRKFRDAEGRRVWTDSISEGQPPMLLGRPVELDEFFPDPSSNSLSIAIGDWQRAYVVVDRPGFKLLLDPYSSKPSVLFYVYRRTGGGMRDSRAVKLIKFAAS